MTDAGRIESMVKELKTSLDTLKRELDPDDVTQVEAELESVMSEQDVIDRGIL